MSSLARCNQDAIGQDITYQSIGVGACGRVFEVTSTTDVFKVATLLNDTALWNDYRMHTRIIKGFSGFKQLEDLHIPKVFYYVNAKGNKW